MFDHISILNYAQIYALLAGVVVVFQLALAAGAPWGSVSMGGKYPGVYPTRMRFAAIVMATLFGALTSIVCIRAGWFALGLLEWSRTAVWVVVALNAVGLLMNLITPSKWERIIWAPVCLLLLLCSTVIAMH